MGKTEAPVKTLGEHKKHAEATEKGVVDLKGETRAEKFRRLGNKRVNAAIDKIMLIGNLGSAQYEGTDAQKTAIVDALLNAVNTVNNQLFKTVSEKKRFEL
jgi:hypothetical protein